MPLPEITLIGRAGCHLCDEAREVVTRVVEGLRAEGVPVSLVERSIIEEPELAARWSEDIPVVLIGTALHDRWHVDAAALRTDLLAAADLE